MAEDSGDRRMLLLNLKASVRALTTAASIAPQDEDNADLNDAIESVVDSIVMALEYGYEETSGTLWDFVAHVFKAQDASLCAEIEGIQAKCTRQTEALREWVLQGLRNRRLSSYIATLAIHPGTKVHYDAGTLLKHERDLQDLRLWITSVENSVAIRHRPIPHTTPAADGNPTALGEATLGSSLPRWPPPMLRAASSDAIGGGGLQQQQQQQHQQQRFVVMPVTGFAPRTTDTASTAGTSFGSTSTSTSSSSLSSSATLTLHHGAASRSRMSSASTSTLLGSSLPSTSGLGMATAMAKHASGTSTMRPIRVAGLRDAASTGFSPSASPTLGGDQSPLSVRDTLALSPIPAGPGASDSPQHALDASGYDGEATLLEGTDADDTLQNRTAASAHWDPDAHADDPADGTGDEGRFVEQSEGRGGSEGSTPGSSTPASETSSIHDMSIVPTRINRIITGIPEEEPEGAASQPGSDNAPLQRTVSTQSIVSARSLVLDSGPSLRERVRRRLPRAAHHDAMRPFLDKESLCLEQDQQRNYRSFTVTQSPPDSFRARSESTVPSAAPVAPLGSGSVGGGVGGSNDVRVIHLPNMTSSHHLMTSAELDRENRHFSVAEAIIEAMEAAKQEFDYLNPQDPLAFTNASVPFSPFQTVNYPSTTPSLNASMVASPHMRSPTLSRSRASSGVSERTAGSSSTPTASSHSMSGGMHDDMELASTLSEGSMLMSASVMTGGRGRLASDNLSHASSSTTSTSHARQRLSFDDPRAANSQQGGSSGGRGRADSTGSSSGSVQEWVDVDIPEHGLNTSQSSIEASTSPTSIARSLLCTQSHGNNVLQLFKFLVDDDDNVPQSMIPMPAITLNDLSNAKGRPLMDVIDTPMSPRIRGNEEWAPPRSQIIFNIHEKPKRSQAMSKQNYRCAGCGLTVQTSYAKLFHYCEYLGKYFCPSCHRRHLSVIPGRILLRWDFKQYPVSNFSRELINSLANEPAFDVMIINPNLVKKVKGLAKAQKLRAQLSLIRPYLQTCRSGTDLMGQIDSPPHTTSDINVYTLNELRDVERGVYVERLQALVNMCVEHIKACPLCTAKGFICELCNNDKEVLFPFDFVKAAQCRDCKDVFHRKCFQKATKGCPKCLRLSTRRQKTNAARAQYLPEVPQPLTLQQQQEMGAVAHHGQGLYHDYYDENENEFELVE